MEGDEGLTPEDFTLHRWSEGCEKTRGDGASTIFVRREGRWLVFDFIYYVRERKHGRSELGVGDYRGERK